MAQQTYYNIARITDSITPHVDEDSAYLKFEVVNDICDTNPTIAFDTIV